MRYESEEKKNLIYDLMNGSLVLDEVKDLWKDQVVDEFAKGSYCSELYEEEMCIRDRYRSVQYDVYRGSVVYRCVRSKTHGNGEHPGKTDPSERRDSDCLETVSGENCFAFLSEKQEIWAYLKKLVEKSL